MNDFNPVRSLFPGGPVRIPRWSVVVATSVAWWLVQPFLVVSYYNAQLRRGAYAPYADSIMIPITEIGALWLLCSPVIACILFVAGRRYRAGGSYFAFADKRPWKNGTIALLVLAAIGCIVGEIQSDIGDGYVLLSLPQLLGILGLLWIRAGCSVG